MPEGDTIFRAARALHKALAGKVVTAFDTGLAKMASTNDDAPLVGRTVEKVEARGKWCLMYFSAGVAGGKATEPLILVTHMLMSGSWHVYRTGEKWWMGRSKMRVAITVGPRVEDPTHAMVPHGWGTPNVAVTDSEAVPLRVAAETSGSALTVGGFQAVAFNVPVVEFHTARSLERSSQVPKLGVDILGDAYSPEAGVRALQQRRDEYPDDEIGVVLLNQRVMAGLGNVYKSEVPFAAGVNPFRQMRTLSEREMQVMADVSLKYMRANVNDGSAGVSANTDGIVTYSGNRRTTNSMNAGDRLWVYGRQGQECRRCGANVMRRLQGEAVRPTYWCPECQPWVPGAGQTAEVAPVGRQVKILGKTRRRGSC